MPDHVQGNREAVEDDAVTVAEHHLVAVPEGIVEFLVVVDGGYQRQSVIIDRIALIVLEIEIEGAAEAGVSLVDLLVARSALTFRADEGARLGLGILGSIDRPMDLRRGRCQHRARSARGKQLKGDALGAHGSVEGKSVEGSVSLSRVAVAGNLPQHVRRHNAKNGMAMPTLAAIRLHEESPVPIAPGHRLVSVR